MVRTVKLTFVVFAACAAAVLAILAEYNPGHHLAGWGVVALAAGLLAGAV